MIENFFNRVRRFDGDRTIWWIILFLFMASVLVVYSSTGTFAYLQKGGNTFYFLAKQLKLIVLCLIVMLLVKSVPYTYFAKFSGIMVVLAIILMIFALVGGAEYNSSARWIQIPYIGLTIQPSEFAKIALVTYSSKILGAYQDEKHCDDAAFWNILVVSGILLTLIFIEDFSTSFLVGATIFVLMIVGRIRTKYWLRLLGIVLVALVALIVLAKTLPDAGRLQSVRNRIDNFMSDEENVNETYNYQIEQSKIAIVRGGILGRGPGKSLQRNFLPLSYSDFIFAIIVEEYGAVGGIVILLLYLVLVYRAGVIIKKSDRVFPALLVMGLSLSMILQAMMNMSVALGIIPITGQPLPLVSMGGSSLLFTSVALGMILSVSRYVDKDKTKDSSTEDENNEDIEMDNNISE